MQEVRNRAPNLRTAALGVFLLLVATVAAVHLSVRGQLAAALEAVPALVRFESLALVNDHRLGGPPVSVFEVSLLIDNTTGLALAIEPSGFVVRVDDSSFPMVLAGTQGLMVPVHGTARVAGVVRVPGRVVDGFRTGRPVPLMVEGRVTATAERLWLELTADQFAKADTVVLFD